MVSLLLARGAFPMQRYLGMTACSEFAKAVSDPTLFLGSHESRNAERRELMAIFRSLLEAGVPASTELGLRTSPHGDLQVQLVNTIPVEWLHMRAPVGLRPAQLECQALRLPTQTFWYSILNLARSTRIIVWVGYKLWMRWVYDAIQPHTLLDVMTILICLAPNAVLVAVLAGREEFLFWL